MDSQVQEELEPQKDITKKELLHVNIIFQISNSIK
jgi:hypothetical protein